MLKGIDPLLTPELLAALASMGHGDELALVDLNYPAASTAQRLVRLSGAGMIDMLSAVLGVFPLDGFVTEPVLRMEVEGEPEAVTAQQTEVAALASRIEGRTISMGSLARHDFYARSRGAFVTVACDGAPFSCFLLRKGVVW
jgi:L-fucose mutarotase